MARRNLTNREDIPADVLRQRRDLYALAIGLLLFYAADGALSEDAGMGSLFSIHLGRAWFVLLAAWIGFFYFWWRFWLISEAKPILDFVEDVRWQTGDLPIVRKIAAKYVIGVERYSREAQQASVAGREGPVPLIFWEGLAPTFDLNAAYRRKPRPPKYDPSPRHLGEEGVHVAPEDHSALRRAWVMGAGMAITRERAFSDYTAPHLFALLTVAVALGVMVHRGAVYVTKPRVVPVVPVVVAPVATASTGKPAVLRVVGSTNSTRAVPPVLPAAVSEAPVPPITTSSPSKPE